MPSSASEAFAEPFATSSSVVLLRLVVLLLVVLLLVLKVVLVVIVRVRVVVDDMLRVVPELGALVLGTCKLRHGLLTGIYITYANMPLRSS